MGLDKDNRSLLIMIEMVGGNGGSILSDVTSYKGISLNYSTSGIPTTKMDARELASALSRDNIALEPYIDFNSNKSLKILDLKWGGGGGGFHLTRSTQKEWFCAILMNFVESFRMHGFRTIISNSNHYNSKMGKTSSPSRQRRHTQQLCTQVIRGGHVTVSITSCKTKISLVKQVSIPSKIRIVYNSTVNKINELHLERDQYWIQQGCCCW